MQTALYIIWALFPLVYFLMTLWGFLENLGKEEKKHKPGDMLKQAIFLTACALVAVGIDQYLLASLVESFSPDFVPLGFYQVMLFPVVLFIGAKVLGGSDPIRITKVSHVTKNRKE